MRSAATAFVSILVIVSLYFTIVLTDLTPKAADNLSLHDMDVTIFCKAESGQITDLQVKYANAHSSINRTLTTEVSAA